MAAINEKAAGIASQVITGKDGQLFITDSSGTNIFLAQVDTFQVQLNVSNTDYQPVGSAWIYSVNTGSSATLTFTEAVVSDEFTIAPLLKDLANGWFPGFNFQGVLRRRDSSAEGGAVYERVTYRNCVPDGSIDIQNLSPGEIVKRSMSFRINALPTLDKTDRFKSSYVAAPKK